MKDEGTSMGVELENFEWQKESCKGEFEREPDLNEWDLKQGFFKTIASLDFEVLKKQKNKK